ncbi:autotransporter domain-containing protein [Achromobacter spanius]|uniref:autotransporter outer membrane beta-barrel domain-containing protein n=1 Tax=Achromobacter spanius TaxID=217203 RepID=UPI0038271F96
MNASVRPEPRQLHRHADGQWRPDLRARFDLPRRSRAGVRRQRPRRGEGHRPPGGVGAAHGAGRQFHAQSQLHRAAQGFEAAGRQGRAFGTAGWRHVFGDVKAESVLAFDAGRPFTVPGALIGRDAALVELGAEKAIARTATLGLGYSGHHASGSREHSANVKVRW